jgi:hypothetical protein
MYWVSLKYKIKLSPLENIALGSLVWNYLLVSFGYMVGIFSNLIKIFFIIFTLSSFLVLISSFYFMRAQKKYKIPIRMQPNSINLLILCTVLLISLFAFTVSHTIIDEYDAIFDYLPKAMSILQTGGLQYNYYTQEATTTITSPAVPMIYAWFRFLCSDIIGFDIGIRIFPFTYLLLTGLIIYLICNMIFQDSYFSAIGVISFISMPVVFANLSSFSLFADLPFIFSLFSSVYIIIKLYNNCDNSNLWWLILGLTLSLMFLQKDLAYFTPFLLFTLLLIVIIPKITKKLAILLTIIISIFFTLPYNIFLLWDIFHYPLYNLSSYITRQLPIFVITIIFSILIYNNILYRDNILKKFSKYNLIAFSAPFLIILIYWIRNYVLFKVPFSLLLYLNERFIAAGELMTGPEILSGALKGIPPLFFDLLRWDILFRAINLGAIFLIPCIIGLFLFIIDSLKKRPDKNSFVLISIFLMLLAIWSWVFYLRYNNSEIRRLYYFAPLFAIFIARGIKAISHIPSIEKTILERFISFDCLGLIYLWSFNVKISSIEPLYVGITLRSLNLVDDYTLMLFMFFFIILFFPYDYIFNQKIKIYKDFVHYIKTYLPLTLILSLSFSLLPLSFTRLSNAQITINSIPDGWQNNMVEVISYINNHIKDNYTIITMYAQHLMYFTDHPVIELTDTYGLMNLQTLLSSSAENFRNNLIDRNIRYLLLPKPGNTHYEIFNNMTRQIKVLSYDEIYRSPFILLLKDFSYFQLFRIMTENEVLHTYRYLSFFEDNWIPLNNYTSVKRVNASIVLSSLVSPLKTITDDNQDMFWYVAKSDPKDQLSFEREEEVKINGNNSLGINLISKQWTSLNHIFPSSQDWSSFARLSFWFYGANTSLPILFTFHTINNKSWVDYFYMKLIDGFIGWKFFTVSLNQFTEQGNPSWSKIDKFEIGFEGSTAKYYLDQIRLEGSLIGIERQITPIITDLTQITMVISIKENSLKNPVLMELETYTKEKSLILILHDKLNSFDISSELFKEGVIIRLNYYPLSLNDSIKFHYLIIISSSVMHEHE